MLTLFNNTDCDLFENNEFWFSGILARHFLSEIII